MSETAPSLRQIARSLRLSHTTVSEALRDSPRVKPATKERVLAAAKAVGYRPNPLAGAMMSEMRRARMGTFRGVLAILDLDGPSGRPETAVRYHRELAAGARDRAEELGFKADLFSLNAGSMTLPRLDTVLRSRGIRGLLLLPARELPNLKGLDLGHYSAVYTDYLMKEPALHAVCADHYMGMMNLLPRVRALGYTRPGLVLEQKHDERLLYRWEAAFNAGIAHFGGSRQIAPLIVPEITREAFATWFKREKPDVVLAHNANIVSWMSGAGASIPETHGFCSLNVSMNVVPCAGMDFHPHLLGARGIELLTAQLFHNEYGPPAVASITTIAPGWSDGPTMRSAKANRGTRSRS